MNGATKDLIAWAVQVMGLEEKAVPTVTSLAKGGSDRIFFRLRWEGQGVLLMRYRHERRENTLYASIGHFLKSIRVAVPEIYHHNADKGLLLMEDLGDDDLWSFRQASWGVRRTLYQKALSAIQRLHAYSLKAFSRNAIPLMEGFDQHLYRWERDYFREHFVEGVCGVAGRREEAEALEDELDALGRRLIAANPALIHRDFQSQNIMIREDEPILIDFQGMRTGNPLYDLGSLLYDPYVILTPHERLDLLAYYYEISALRPSWPSFLEQFREASAQRLMQALGAYGFLGLKKGRTNFLEYIAGGLRNLIDASSQVTRLPVLRELAIRCQGAIEKKGIPVSP